LILNNFDYRYCFIYKQRIFIVYVYISLASSGTTLGVIEDSSGSESEELCSIPIPKKLKRKRRDLQLDKTVETDNEDSTTSITQGTQETGNEDTQSTPNTQAEQGKNCYL